MRPPGHGQVIETKAKQPKKSRSKLDSNERAALLQIERNFEVHKEVFVELLGYASPVLNSLDPVETFANSLSTEGDGAGIVSGTKAVIKSRAIVLYRTANIAQEQSLQQSRKRNHKHAKHWNKIASRYRDIAGKLMKAADAK